MEKSILVVDDAKFARTVTKKILANANINNVIEATSAAEAEKLFTTEKPDVTLLDISLPDSQDLGLLEKLLRINPEANIVMCSALGQDLIIRDALKIGAKDFIIKPVDKSLLVTIVNRYLNKQV